MQSINSIPFEDLKKQEMRKEFHDQIHDQQTKKKFDKYIYMGSPDKNKQSNLSYNDI